MEKIVKDAASEAKRLLVDAALDMTRMKGPMRKACRLVLLDGVHQIKAAKMVKRDRRNVSRALATLKPRLAEVQAEFDRAVSS